MIIREDASKKIYITTYGRKREPSAIIDIKVNDLFVISDAETGLDLAMHIATDDAYLDDGVPSVKVRDF